MKNLRKIASGNNNNNLISRFRRKRFKIFQTYLARAELTNPKIIDVGGTGNYWNHINLNLSTNFKPIINNISKDEMIQTTFNCFVDDGKCLSSVKDDSFDIEFAKDVNDEVSKYVSIENSNELDSDIEYSEIEYVIKNLANGKASGVDEVITEVIKYSDENLKKVIWM